MNFAKTKFIQTKIQFNSCYCGCPLSAITLPRNCGLLGIVRSEKLILASDNPTVYYGDDILAVAVNPGMAPELQLILKKRHPVLWSNYTCSLNGEYDASCEELFIF